MLEIMRFQRLKRFDYVYGFVGMIRVKRKVFKTAQEEAMIDVHNPHPHQDALQRFEVQIQELSLNERSLFSSWTGGEERSDCTKHRQVLKSLEISYLHSLRFTVSQVVFGKNLAMTAKEER